MISIDINWYQLISAINCIDQGLPESFEAFEASHWHRKKGIEELERSPRLLTLIHHKLCRTQQKICLVKRCSKSRTPRTPEGTFMNLYPPIMHTVPHSTDISSQWLGPRHRPMPLLCGWSLRSGAPGSWDSLLGLAICTGSTWLKHGSNVTNMASEKHPEQGSDLHMLRDVDSDIPVFTRPIDRPSIQDVAERRLTSLAMREWLVWSRHSIAL